MESETRTTTIHPVSDLKNQQFHDLHTLDIGRHVADKGHSSLLTFGITFGLAFGLNFDLQTKRRKKKRKMN
jgi:hypothetical protein